MKTKITIIALAAIGAIFIGCTGTPVAIDRFGSAQPDITAWQQQEIVKAAAACEIKAIETPDFHSEHGITEINQYPFGFFPRLSWKDLENNGSLNQINMGLLLNNDASLTVFRTDKVQFRWMPMSGIRY